MVFLRLRCSAKALVPVVAAAFLLRLGAAQDQYGVPYKQCFRIPTKLNEAVGSSADDVVAMCLKTSSGLTATFENADKFFIGNSSSSATRVFGVFCRPITVVLRINDDGSFTPDVLPPGFSNQAWGLSVWQPAPGSESGVNQTILLSVNNGGNGDLQLTGIDYASLGLPANFSVESGNSTILEIPRAAINLTYEMLPLLEDYLLGDNVDLEPNSTTGVVILKYLTATGPHTPFANIAYIFVTYTAGQAHPYSFYLYESQYYLPVYSIGGRRLLAPIPPRTVAPAAACAKGACGPAKPMPPTCRPGSPTFPKCASSCKC